METSVHDTAGVVSSGRLKVLVFVEHDIIYRHFVRSRVFDHLGQRHEVVFVVPEGPAGAKRMSVALAPEEVVGRITKLHVDPARLFQWRRLFQVSQFVWRPGLAWKRLRALTRRFVGPRASVLYTVLALPGIYHIFRARTLRTICAMPSGMAELIERERPDVLVHPTVLDGLFVNDIVLHGAERGLPTVLIMNSWDNPSTKRAVVGTPDALLVWGPQTKSHAVTFMGMAPDRVLEFGAAQFDIYRAPARIDRVEFCRRHNVDPAHPVLLYAGSSKGTDEFAHLRRIEDAIDAGKLPLMSVIYRPHPWGAGGFRGERIIDHAWRHVRIEESMRAYLEAVRDGRKGISLPDYAETHDVLSNVDALVSPLSTIILEALLHGKPALCFLAAAQAGSSLDLQATLVHFEDMYDDPEVPIARGEDALIPGLADLMGKVGEPGLPKRLAASAAHFVTSFEAPYGERLTACLEQLARGDRP
jgi:hypothetical protein